MTTWMTFLADIDVGLVYIVGDTPKSPKLWMLKWTNHEVRWFLQ